MSATLRCTAVQILNTLRFYAAARKNRESKQRPDQTGFIGSTRAGSPAQRGEQEKPRQTWAGARFYIFLRQLLLAETGGSRGFPGSGETCGLSCGLVIVREPIVRQGFSTGVGWFSDVSVDRSASHRPKRGRGSFRPRGRVPANTRHNPHPMFSSPSSSAPYKFQLGSFKVPTSQLHLQCCYFETLCDLYVHFWQLASSLATFTKWSAYSSKLLDA